MRARGCGWRRARVRLSGPCSQPGAARVRAPGSADRGAEGGARPPAARSAELGVGVGPGWLPGQVGTAPPREGGDALLPAAGRPREGDAGQARVSGARVRQRGRQVSLLGPGTPQHVRGASAGPPGVPRDAGGRGAAAGAIPAASANAVLPPCAACATARPGRIADAGIYVALGDTSALEGPRRRGRAAAAAAAAARETCSRSAQGHPFRLHSCRLQPRVRPATLGFGLLLQ